MLVDEYPLLKVLTECSSLPSLCVTVAAYSSSSTGAPPKRTFLSMCGFCISTSEVRRIHLLRIEANVCLHLGNQTPVFRGVCAAGKRLPFSRDPPPPHNTKE